jgi:hypothetical protein
MSSRFTELTQFANEMDVVLFLFISGVPSARQFYFFIRSVRAFGMTFREMLSTTLAYE